MPRDAPGAAMTTCLDAAAAGTAATIRWGTTRLAIVDADQLRTALAALCPSPVEAVWDNGSWSMTVRGLPIEIEGTDIDTVIADVITALRTRSPLHTPHTYGEWVLHQLIQLSDDTQLRDWTIGSAHIHLH